jgi:hypothetical protein
MRVSETGKGTPILEGIDLNEYRLVEVAPKGLCVALKHEACANGEGLSFSSIS